MAQPGPAPAAGVYPINVHWTSKKGWWFTPDRDTVPLNKTVRFNTDKNCTICFIPTDTPFGSKLDVTVGAAVDIQVGPND